MADRYENQALETLQGKFQAKVICCILGIGGLVAWNSLLTIADYYYHVFPVRFCLPFYFTAKYGDQGWMIMLVTFLGWTTGHLNVCILIIAPKGYKGPEKNALGNLLVVFVTGGIVVGTSLGWLWLIGKNNAF
ncbi:hypothetical protein F2Q68_00020482 [Brassica cretica]|uniref:Uncharacterized protein n=1 Tax=Brassica cretica TaxID=69181 RepID=A0A8S9G8G7_BRACR|nr:hypothetical protein F2Q68_00020482 [Brassica cretica]